MDAIILGADFLPDIQVTKFSSQKRPEEAVLSFNCETLEIICKNSASEKNDERVSLFDVKEVRSWKKCRDFEKLTSDRKISCSRFFVVMYGAEFRLKTLSVAATSKKDCEDWVMDLNYLLKYPLTSYMAKLNIWFTKQYESMMILPAENQKGLPLKQIKDFTNRISFKISTGKLREKFQCMASSSAGHLNKLGFQTLFREFLHDQQIFTDIFSKYAMGERVDVDAFKVFLEREQNESEWYSEYELYFREYFNSGNPGIPYMNRYEAVDLLFSKQNQVWDPRHDLVCQDMTRPLSHYWIATSHNTYLMGNQLSSESSVEAYAKCLQLGCRCLELDCWDGANGPIIRHGHTLTSTVCFVEVIKTIKNYAFVTSEYPVILSIENHCTVSQQKVMAKKLKDVFGERLITRPLYENETRLPSPHELRGKIILKGRKIPKGSEKNREDYDEEDKMDLSCCTKKGKMYIQEENQWKGYFFALTSDKLIYTEIDEERRKSCESIYAMVVEELHFSKKWFHGKIIGGVRTAEQRVKTFGVEGAFLVRTSETCPSDYSLCFLLNGTAHHVRIKSNEDQSQYFLLPSETFDSLYSLVRHYRKNPLKTRDFCIERFTMAVPIPENHEHLPWFYPNQTNPEPMDRKKSEEILHKIPLNGTFLVRYSGEYIKTGKGDRFVITFCMDNRIRHCRVKQDGRLLAVSNSRFENIEKLVQYYSTTRGFYKGLKLKHAVNEELYKYAHSSDATENNDLYTCGDYLDTNTSASKQVRAICNYEPANSEMLHFQKGDVITNVVKEDGVWWKGDLGDQIQKTFPDYFVEEMETTNSPFGELEKGSVALGKVDVEEQRNDSEFPYILKIYCPNSAIPFKAALKSEKEAIDWKEKITKVNEHATLVQRKHKTAHELSKQIVYCSTVSKLEPDQVKAKGRVYNEMKSFSEVNGSKLMSLNPEFYLWYHEIQISRVYPKGHRIYSSNYNPIRYWNFGCQMVALNYQTPDRSMQLNNGKFRQNGRCGYVLRPEFMFGKIFNPGQEQDLEKNEIQALNFKILVAMKEIIIAARHVSRTDNRPISSPFVEVEVVGASFDCQKIRTKKTIVDNGFNPYWGEKFMITVLNPDLALIRFSVSDQDNFGDSHFLGQVTYPVRCLRQGYRSVPLENGYGHELLSSLLINLQSW